MFCASYVYLFYLCWTGFTSPQPIVGRVYPSTLAFYPSKGRLDGSLDEAVIGGAIKQTVLTAVKNRRHDMKHAQQCAVCVHSLLDSAGHDSIFQQ